MPEILSALILTNNRLTEMVKFWLNSPSLPVNPPDEVKRLIVLFSSLLIGIISVAVMPESMAWLPDSVRAYPYASIFITGVAVSYGGAAAQHILELFSILEQPKVRANESRFSEETSTTVTIS